MNIKVSDLVAEFLKKAEIKVIFGIIGSANSHLFDSITKLDYTQIVCVHHEQAAVMAAGAYFRTSGKLSAAIVTAGAGSSNAVTGVVSNWADSIPCIIISGQEQTCHIKSHSKLRMWGIQGFDSPKMVKDVTKYSTTIMDENLVQDELEYARHVALDRRPGPVWLDFPFDVQAKMVKPREWDLEKKYDSNPFAFDAAPVLINMNFESVRELLKNSQRPVIWGGHGVRLAGAKEQFRKLVDTLQIPTILTWSAIDLLSEDNPYYFGRAGVSGQRRANFIIQNSDLILVLGSRLSLLQAGYDIKNLAPKAKIVMVDIDQGEWIKNNEKIHTFINMDCKYFIEEFQKHMENYYHCTTPSCLKGEWMNYCCKIKDKYPLRESTHVDGGDQYLNSYNFLDEVCKYMYDDQIIVTDMGTALLSGHYSLKLTENQTMFTSLGLGEMGYGLPGAIGAAFAAPDRQVLCLNCDGGMMMNLQELQTIIHHNLPIKIIIFENDGYLMIKHTQKMLFKGAYNCVNYKTGMSLPDFVQIGDAFGFNTYSLNGNCRYAISDTLTKFFESRNPSILVVHMNPEQDFIPKVKGVPQDDGTIVPASLEEMSPLLPFDEIKSAMKWGLSEKSKQIKR